MLDKDCFLVTVYGARGSVPSCTASCCKYGGNTSCFLIQAGEQKVILDCGSGIARMGSETNIFNGDILLSHTHLDHILGLPFFMPLYNQGNSITIHGAMRNEQGIREQIDCFMGGGTLPTTTDNFSSLVLYHSFNPCQAFNIGAITVTTVTARHPGGGILYKLTYKEKSICFIMDHEHSSEQEAVEAFARGADLVVFDAHFDDGEYPLYKGWGHSTWQEGIRFGNRNYVKNTLLAHHAPFRTDAEIDRWSSISKEGNWLFAREGDTIVI